LSVSGLPPGVTASFSPAGSGSANNITLTAKDSSNPGSSTITITGTSGGLSHTVTANLAVTAMRTGTVAVDLSSAYNAKAIYTDGTAFAAEASADGEGFAYSKEALGSTPLWDGILFNLGPANAPDVVTSKTVALPAGKFAALRVLAAGVEGSQEAQVFTITYADGTSASITQSLSDWYHPRLWSRPIDSKKMAPRTIARFISTGILSNSTVVSQCAASRCPATSMRWSSP